MPSRNQNGTPSTRTAPVFEAVRVKHTYLIKAIASVINHSFQLSLVVVKNLPRNSIIKICAKEISLVSSKRSNIRPCYLPNLGLLTWNTTVIPIIIMKRLLLVTPLRTFSSSGFRALNSLNTWRIGEKFRHQKGSHVELFQYQDFKNKNMLIFLVYWEKPSWSLLDRRQRH